MSTALEQIGIRVQDGYVLFGIEIHLKGGEEPTVNLDLPPGTTLADALRQVFQQLPGYRYKTVGERLINIYPVGANLDPQNPLNIRVQQFNVVNEQASSILSAPQLFVQEIAQRLTPPTTTKRGPQPSGSVGPRMRGTTPGVTLHLKNVTVREILNATSEATQHFPLQYSPLGWVYYFDPDSSLPAGGRHTWKFHMSAPTEWKRETQKSGRPQL